MIIRATLKTNLYTQIIERYFDDGGPFVLTYHSSKAEYELFKKNVHKLHDCNINSKNREMCKIQLQSAIYKNFFNYINTITQNNDWETGRFTAKKITQYKDFIFKHFEVKIVNLITDTSFNKEVVFYIYQINRYVTL